MAVTQGKAENFILFMLGETTYGIRSSVVQQMEMIEQITPVPNSPTFVEGIVFLRGEVIPVISLRKKFGFDRIPYDLTSRMVVVKHGERVVGFTVDTAREFVSIKPETIKPPPDDISSSSKKHLEGICSFGERLVLLLNIGEVINLPQINISVPEGA